MSETITIASRYNGPPKSGNGGYSAGILAVSTDFTSPTVQLRAPPPLDTALDLVSVDGGFEARLDDQLVMAVQPSAPLPEPPIAPDPSVAIKGRDHFVSAEDHAFPSCFVCGPHRAEGDGLRIFTGPLSGFDGVGDIWTPDESLADADGIILPEIIWSALDCPGAFAVGFSEAPMVLAQITAEIYDRPSAGGALTVIGWEKYHDGRKHGAGTAIYRADGQCLAQSDQLWIELKPKTA